MQKLIGYALAFGAGIGAAKFLQWSPVGGQHHHGEQTPGSKMTIKGHILDMGARMAVRELNRQLVAHHYCSHINQDVRQCVIYDSDRADARLIGVEYIISEKLFNELPAEEKKLWHSHVYEVKSGALIAPGVPDIAEKEVMKELINTYGKTFHTWQIDRGDPIPLGVPQLMMAFVKDGQINEDLIHQRDEYYKLSTEGKKRQREDIKAPNDTQGADAWSKSGKAVQLTTTESKMKMTK
ncbi:unnamed protein product [Rotaria sp. Silwood1]|nr:unnamed protein product [Rotaria sp. Silwood1]CAF0909255.1 unnamed protein product [Rotaria sp. Silwood1]CAF3352425.1 unnamed protein product [Rotaria sp. Silwood1]CAF3375627.1 unnamed protein product [Rotaria sp. Silwood1]CAF4638625.1 unnamed protein product [Rotaria sp. Silwood1]